MLGEPIATQRIQEAETSAPRAVCGSGELEFLAVLLVDEIDSLSGMTLTSILDQLRTGYKNRPRGFPQSIVLCGVRDVQDQDLQPMTGKHVGPSPFNIIAKSLSIGNFSEAEIRAMYPEAAPHILLIVYSE